MVSSILYAVNFGKKAKLFVDDKFQNVKQRSCWLNHLNHQVFLKVSRYAFDWYHLFSAEKNYFTLEGIHQIIGDIFVWEYTIPSGAIKLFLKNTATLSQLSIHVFQKLFLLLPKQKCDIFGSRLKKQRKTFAKRFVFFFHLNTMVFYSSSLKK